MAEIRKGLIVTNSSKIIKTFTDDISSNVNLNLGSGYNTVGSTSYPIQFSHLTSGDGEQKAVTINNGLVGIDISNNGPKAKLHIGKEYFGKNSILQVSKPASVINEHTSQISTGNHNYFKIAQISVPSGATCCYGGLNIKGTIIGKENLIPTTSGFASNFMRFDITIMVNHANTGNGSSPNLYMIGTVNGSAMNTDTNSTATTPSSIENDIIVSKNHASDNYPMGVVLCVHKESVCNIEITSTAYNHSDINCFTIDYDGVRKPTDITKAYANWQSDSLLQLSDPTKNDIIYNTPHGVGIKQNNPFTTFAVKGNMVIGSGTGYNVGDQQQRVLTGMEVTGSIENSYSTADFANGLLVEGKVGIGTNKLYTNTKLHIKDTTLAFNLTLQNDNNNDSLDGQETNIRFHNYQNATIAMIQARKHGIDGAASGSTDPNNSNADLAFLTNNDTGHTNTPDQKMIIKYDGKVGIGTNFPKSGLDISSNLTVGNSYAGTNAAPTNGMIVEGAVGIGTDNPNTLYKLEVSGDVLVSGSSDANGSNKITIGETYADNTNSTFHGNTTFTNITSQRHLLLKSYGHTASDGYITFSAGDGNTEHMRIRDNGNVGIGTDNPQTALQITSSSGLRLTNTAVKYNANERIGYIDFSNYNNGTGAAIESCVNITGDSTTANNADLRFMTTLDYNNTYVERMRIDRSGNVGIGTTTPNASYKLDVSGNVRLTGNNDVVQINLDSTNGAGTDGNGSSFAYFSGQDDNTVFQGAHNTRLRSNNGEITFYSGAGTVYERMKITSDGILKGNSDGHLGHPQTNIYFKINHTNYNIPTSVADQIRLRDDGDVYISSTDASEKGIRFYNGSTETMRITQGNVGIGTTSPTAKLHIANEGTSNGEITALRLSNRGDAHASARSIFDFVVQDIVTGSAPDLGQRKMSIRFKAGYDGMDDGNGGTTSWSETDMMMFDGNNDSVGIGSTAPIGKLQVFGDKGLTISGNNDSSDHRTAVLRLGSPYTVNNDAYCAKITSFNDKGSDYKSDLRFYTHDGQKTGDAVGDPGVAAAKERMSILSNGNVGIGTTTPSATLHIVRPDGTTGVVDNTVKPALEVYKNFNGVLDSYYAARIYGTDSDIGETGIRICEKGASSLTSNSTKVLDVYSNGSSNMVVTGAGNIGIGTSSPNVILDISGTDALRLPVGDTNARPATTDEATNGGYVRYNNGTHQFEGYGPGNSWGSLGGVINVAQNTKIIAESSPAATNNDLQFFTAPTNNVNKDDATERMRIDANGNVGIGTTNPEGNLHISSSGDAILKITGDSEGTSGTNHPYLIFQQDYGSNGVSYAFNEAGIFLGTGDDNTGDTYENDLIISASTNGGGSIHFKTNGTSNSSSTDLSELRQAPTRMTITETGNIGIGTTSPSTPLDIYRLSGIGQSTMLNIVNEFTGDTGAPAVYTSTIANIQATGTLTKNTDGDTVIGLNVDIGDGIGATNKYTALFNGGNVGIGTTTPGHTLHVVGDTRLQGTVNIGPNDPGGGSGDQAYLRYHVHTGEVAELQLVCTNDTDDDIGFYPSGQVNCNATLNATSFNATSDIRHKENIVELENSLEKITSLRAVNYNLKETPNVKAAGLIAQEVDEVIPEAISKRKEDKWTLDYNSITGYLVGCIKELKKENDELKEEMKRKNDVIVKLHNDVSSIKEMLKIKY